VVNEAIRSWEERLAPLTEAVPEIEPPRDLLPAIEARIRGASSGAPGNGTSIFPNADACRRLVRALAVETHENWLEAHRYLNMNDLKEHKKIQLRQAA
jgi:hypothetical protein